MPETSHLPDDPGAPAPSRPPRLRRRSLLAAGAGAAAAGLPLSVSGSSGAAADEGTRAVFAHGVASGDPLPHAVVLWTRVTPTASATPGSGNSVSYLSASWLTRSGTQRVEPASTPLG